MFYIKFRCFRSIVPVHFCSNCIHKAIPPIPNFGNYSYEGLLKIINNPIKKLSLNENISIIYKLI